MKRHHFFRRLATIFLFAITLLVASSRSAPAQELPPVEVKGLPDQRLRIQWPETTNMVSLESSAALGAAQFWQPVLTQPEAQNGMRSVTVSPQLNREFFRLRNEGPPPFTTIGQSSPVPGEANVSVYRETILSFTRPLADGTTVHPDVLYATFAGRRIFSRLALSSDRRDLTLFYLEPLPAGARIRVTFDASGLLDDLGRPVDADGDGVAGGAVWMDFDTSGVLPVPGTAVIGHVFASELMSNGSGGFTNRPLAGVTVTVDGAEETLRATTDTNGFFQLEPCPSGRFFVHVDGRTAVGSDWPAGAYYPFVGKAWEAVAGRTNLAGGSGEIFLPLIAPDALQPVSMVEETTVTFPPSVLAQNPELAGVSITVPPNALYADDGQRGGRVGLAPVPPDRLPEPLPEGLEFPLVITVQTDGPSNFEVPIPVRFPNLPDPVTGVKLGPGEKTALWSFNHDTGRWEIQGPMTVTADGDYVESDPGFGINQPGWHGVALGAALAEILSRKYCEDQNCAAAIALGAIDLAYGALSGVIGSFSTKACVWMGAQFGAMRSAADCRGDKVDCWGTILGNTAGIGSCALPTTPQVGALIGVGLAAIPAAVSIWRNCAPCMSRGTALAASEPRHELVLLAHFDFLAAHKEFIDLVLGSPVWTTSVTPETENAKASAQMIGDILAGIFAAAHPWSAGGIVITAAEAAGIGALPRPDDFAASHVSQTIEYINRTTTFYQQGIFTHAAAGRTDFLDTEEADAALANLVQAADALQALGVRSFDAFRALDAFQTAEAQRLGVPVRRSDLSGLYFMVEEMPDGAVTRGRLGADGRLNLAAVRPLTVFRVTLFDPKDLTWGNITFRSADVGRLTVMPQILLVSAEDETDSDGDLLPDPIEEVIGTNPNNPDTDGDDIPDGVEVQQGTNPLDELPVRTGVIASAPTSAPALHVAVQDDVAVTANGTGGIAVFDVSNPFQPARVAEIDTPGNAVAVAIHRNLVAIADGSAGLAMVDISDPPAARIVRQIPMGSTVQAVATEGSLAHVGLSSGEVVTVDLETGRVLNRHQLSGMVDDISVAGDIVHVLTRTALMNLRWTNGAFATLGSVNISGSPSPQETGRKLFAGGGLAYVGYFSGYSIVNVSNPAAPAIIGAPPVTQTAVHDLAANGSGLLLNITSFAGPSTFAVSLYDVSNPTDVTRFLISHDTPGTSRAVAIHNGLAFVADGPGGLQVVNYLAYDALGQAPAIQIGGNFEITNGAAVVPEDQPARVSALVSDDVQVRNVEFYLDGERVFVNGSFPFEFRFTAPPITVTRSNFTIRARALDTGGNFAWTDEILVTLLPDPTPPVVRSMFPAPNAYIGRITNVRLNFSKSLDVDSLSGSVTLVAAGPDGEFDTGDDIGLEGLTLEYLQDDRAVMLSASESLPPGLYRVNVSDSVQDLTGNPLAQPFVAEFQTGDFVDNDFDGLPDFLEPALGFDFLNPDTLGVGSLDGELDLNTNGFSSAADYFAGRPMTPGLVPGTTVTDVLAAGALARFEFDAEAGKTVIIAAGANGFTPLLRLFGPDGALLASTNSVNAALGHLINSNGTYRVLLTSQNPNQSGAYNLVMLRIPDEAMVPEGDDGGTLTNGVSNVGTVDPGDVDLWTFTANAGEQVWLRLGTAIVYPSFTVFDPSGVVVASVFDGSTTRDAVTSFAAPITGTFTVLVRSHYTGGSGSYLLSYAKVPGAFVVAPNDEGGALTNGVNHSGMIERGDLDLWTFTASQGDQVWLRLASTTTYPALTVYAPDGTQVAAGNDGTTTRDARVDFVADVTGTFTVVVRSYYEGGVGPYALSYARVPGEFVVSPDDEGGTLANGGSHAGTIERGDLELWAFSAEAGDQVWLRLGTTSVYPALTVYGPDGAEVAAGEDGTTTRDASVSFAAPVTGTFTVIAQSFYNGGTGPYVLSYAKAPGEFIVPPGDQGGALTNGGHYEGTIDHGDLDPWTFTATEGDQVLLRLASSVVYPAFTVLGPDGTEVAADFDGTASRDARVAFAAPETGTFTVIVRSYYNGGNGTYSLHYVKVPGEFIVPAGDEGGTMTNNVSHGGTLPRGDLDVWKFEAGSGDALMLRMGTTNLTPRLRVFGPGGALLAEVTSASSFNRDNFVILSATNSGTYTVIADAALAGQSGSYNLTLVRVPSAIVVSPGDQGGAMTNGGVHVGDLPVGDVDVWSFSASAGDAVFIRVGITNGSLTPWIRIYGPSGALVDEASSASSFNRDNHVALQATNDGTYTVVISAALLGQAGSYHLHLARAPGEFVVTSGDQGGAITNGGVHIGDLPVGDLDIWSLSADAGDALIVRAGIIDGSLTPWLRVYGPNGALVSEASSTSSFNRDNHLLLRATNGGTYTVVICAALFGQAGSYHLHVAQAPGEFVVPDGDEGGALTDGVVHQGTMSLGDLDLWSFSGASGQSITLRAETVDFTPWIRIYGPDGALVAEFSLSNSFLRTAVLPHTLTQNGTYTVVFSAAVVGQSGTYELEFDAP